MTKPVHSAQFQFYKLTDIQNYFPQVGRQTSSKLSSPALVGNGAIVNVFTHLTVCSFRFSSGADHCGRYLSDIGPQTVKCQIQKAKKMQVKASLETLTCRKITVGG